MAMIRECVVTTIDATGHIHIAPLGLIEDGEHWVIAPFRPSATLHNLKSVPFATANYVDDVRIIAGCLTGRRDWPIADAPGHPVPRLTAALAHAELSGGARRRRRNAAAILLPGVEGRNARAVPRPQPR